MECEHAASLTARAVKVALPERAILAKDARATLNSATSMFTLYLASVYGQLVVWLWLDGISAHDHEWIDHLGHTTPQWPTSGRPSRSAMCCSRSKIWILSTLSGRSKNVCKVGSDANQESTSAGLRSLAFVVCRDQGHCSHEEEQESADSWRYRDA